MGIGTRLLLGSLALALTTSPAWPAKKELIPPPQGKSVGMVEVPRGGRITINLAGIDRNKRPLKFGIDRPPRYGRLGNIAMQQESPDKATVVYTHGDDDESAEDSFIFTVRAASGGPAGRSTVKIRIVDQPATLLAPAEIDFGGVVIGETAQRRCEISNLGGGELAGKLEAPEPFSVQGPADFLLKRGARRNFTLNFSPSNTGPYTFRVQPSPHDPAIIELKGEALSPFSVRAESDLFVLQRDDSRTAEIKIQNNSTKPLTLAVKLPPDLPVSAPASLKIAPDQTAAVTLRIDPAYKKSVPAFSVQFIAHLHTEICELSAPAIPPSLQVSSEPDFGALEPGRTAQAKLVVQNNGGAQADFEVQTGESLRLLDAPPAISLAPGAAREISLQLRLGKNETLPPMLRLVFQGNAIPVNVRAKIAEPEAPAASEPTPVATVSAPVSPAEAAPPYVLNQDLVLMQPGGTIRLEWIEKQNWNAYTLQQRPPGSEFWQTYEPPHENDGLVAWVASIPQKIRGFLDTPIQRNEPGELPKVTRRSILLDPQSIDTASVWRLRGTPVNSTEPENLTPEFLITPQGLVPAPATPTPAPSPTVEKSERTQLSPLVEEPVTNVLSAGIQSEKHAANLRIALARDPDVVNFRLERGAMIAQLDPADGIPHQPRFEPVPHDDGKVEIEGFSNAESEGKQYTIVAARIEGLPSGARTYWRLVPITKDGERPPTSVLLVDTLPVPPFSWRNFFLWGSLAILAGVLFLRWRINRVP